MYKLYLKQAFQMLMQNKTFSIIYIAGTGLAITMVMVLTVLYFLRTANIEPENNRSRMLICKYSQLTSKENENQASRNFSYFAVRECFYALESPELITAVLPATKPEIIQVPGKDDSYQAMVLGTDVAFWNMFKFRFLDGIPYSEGEFEAGIRKAVISASVSRMLFGSEQSTGKTFNLNYEPFQVAGVVADIPSFAKNCYAEIWIPFTTRPQNIAGNPRYENILGQLYVYMLAKNSSDFNTIRQEAEQSVKRFNTTTQEFNLSLEGQPDTITQSLIRTDHTVGEPNYNRVYIRIAVVLFILLLVPAINLTGLSSLRMSKRTEEIGIRKAFGALNKTLLTQVLYENFILTLLGGVTGLFISLGLVYSMKGWLLNSYNWAGISITPSLDFSLLTLLNPALFIYTFIFCLILNLLSAFIPAYCALQKPIINALYSMPYDTTYI